MPDSKIEFTELLKIPDDLKPGRYKLALAVVESETENPAVRLAITGRARDGWYHISEFDVTALGAKR
ncbi:MAG: hypothetical protein SVV80_00285 [Planctomycetota bacterium]|nr:hypothetical protein [Planctomycetota bacterium]